MKPSSRLSSALTCVTLFLTMAGLMVTLTWPLRRLVIEGANDFLSFYAGARLSGTQNLYDREAARAVQRQAANMDSETLPFIRLPYYAALLKPLGFLPYSTAYAIWQALNAAAWIGFALLMPNRSRLTVLVASICSIPIYVSFMNGQDLPIVLFFLAAALRFAGGADFKAGLCLSLCLAKFHLFLLVPLVILLKRRWRLGAGAATGVSILLVLSFAVGGLTWPFEYLKLLRDGSFHKAAVVTPNIAGLLRLAGAPAELLWPLVLIMAAAVCWIALQRSFEEGVAAALIAAVAANSHGFLQDTVLLLPACFLLLSRPASRAVRTLASSLLLPFVYLIEFTCPPPWGSVVPLTVLLTLAAITVMAPAPGARTLPYRSARSVVS